MTENEEKIVDELCQKLNIAIFGRSVEAPSVKDILAEALQQARKDGARDEVTLGFRHFSDYEFVRDYFKVRLAELDGKEKE